MRPSKRSALAGTIAMSLCLISSAFAQDPAMVDSKHYKVEFENDQVRVLRITYGPGERSVMHEHPNAVVVSLTDLQGQFTFPDGNPEAITSKAGRARWAPATKHLPENTGRRAFRSHSGGDQGEAGNRLRKPMRHALTEF